MIDSSDITGIILAGLVIVPTLASLAVPALAGEPVFDPQAVRAHVTFLADDLLEGRDTGSRGYDIAANYVAAQFIAGLQALRAGDDPLLLVLPSDHVIADENAFRAAVLRAVPAAAPAKWSRPWRSRCQVCPRSMRSRSKPHRRTCACG